MLLHGVEKIPHLAALVDDVVGQEEARTVEARIDEVEEALVVFLPGVEEDEVESARQLRNRLERIAAHDLDHARQSRALDIRGELTSSRGIVLDGDEAAARFAQAHRDPDGAVPAGPANLERALRALGRDHDPQESSIFLRDRQLSRVLLLDVRKNFRDIRTL